MEKLVRDKIPELILSDGWTPLFHHADDTEYRESLRRKLREECEEFVESGEKEELADILEVILTIAKDMEVSWDELEELRVEKSARNGGFEERIILDGKI